MATSLHSIIYPAGLGTENGATGMCTGKPVPMTAAGTVVFTGHLGDHLYGSIAEAPQPRDD